MRRKHNPLIQACIDAGVPESAALHFWKEGRDVKFKSNTILSKPDTLGDAGLYFESGIIREYLVAKSGIEHTLRILIPPSTIFPSLPKLTLGKPSKLVSHAVTNIEGRIFDKTVIYRAINQYPQYYKVIIDQIALALIDKKSRVGFKRHQLTAKENYLDFIENYPGVTNQIPLKYIASFLKLTPETISRIRTELSNSKPHKS